MADTRYLTQVVEPHLVSWVGKLIGKTLVKRQVVVGRNRAGREVAFEFDGVSADGTTAVLASASGSINPGQERKLFMDAAILLRVPFERRIMAFVERGVWIGFENRCDGLLDLHLIEPMICDGPGLPAAMRDKIAEVHRAAQDEGGERAGPRRRPGPRREST